MARTRISHLSLAAAIWLLLLCTLVGAEQRSVPVTLGVQPLSIPPIIVSETMHHDGILADALSKHGFQLVNRPFPKGGDIVARLDGSKSGRVTAPLFSESPC